MSLLSVLGYHYGPNNSDTLTLLHNQHIIGAITNISVFKKQFYTQIFASNIWKSSTMGANVQCTGEQTI